MQIAVRSRVWLLITVSLALFTGCAKRAPSPEWMMEQMPAYGGGLFALLYPKLQERPLAGPSAGGDTVVRVFYADAFRGMNVRRVERRSTGWVYVQKYLDEDKGVRLNADSSLTSATMVENLLYTILLSNYWQGAGPRCSRLQLDGTSVTIEARIGANYHTVRCAISRADSLPTDVEKTLAALRVIAAKPNNSLDDERRSTLAKLAGCYRVTIGAWRQTGAAFGYTPPTTFRLDTALARVEDVLPGSRGLTPMTIDGISMSMTNWHMGPADSLTLVWSKGYGAGAYHLQVHGDTVTGIARSSSDVITNFPDPTAPVSGVRITCP